LDTTEEKMGMSEDGAIEMVQQETEKTKIKKMDTISRDCKAVSDDLICG